MAGERAGRSPLPEGRGERFTQNRQGDCSGATHSGHRAPGNGCGRGSKSKGKAETAARDKNVSGAAECGESRRGGTRAVSFADPCHFIYWRTLDCPQLPLAGRSSGEAGVSAPGARRKLRRADPEGDPAERGRNQRQPASAQRENARGGKDRAAGRARGWELAIMENFTGQFTEYYTVKQIDNSRLERPRHPAQVKDFWRRLAVGAAMAAR